MSEEEWQWLRGSEDSPDYPQGLFNRADEYLMYPQDLKTLEKGLFGLVLALAIMSFVPSGVEIFGLRFCSEMTDFVEIEAETENGSKT